MLQQEASRLGLGLQAPGGLTDVARHGCARSCLKTLALACASLRGCGVAAKLREVVLKYRHLIRKGLRHQLKAWRMLLALWAHTSFHYDAASMEPRWLTMPLKKRRTTTNSARNGAAHAARSHLWAASPLRVNGIISPLFGSVRLSGRTHLKRPIARDAASFQLCV